MKTRFLSNVVIAFLPLAACSLAPDYERPELTFSNEWRGALGETADAVSVTRRDWWKSFNSAELDRYIDVALTRNNELEAALHRIRQARAQMRIAGASLWPDVGASGAITRNWDEAFRRESDGVTGFRAGLDASYELDLWGRNRDNARSARYGATATLFDRDALQLVVIADVAMAYAQVLALNEQLEVTTERYKAAQDILRIVDVRFREGAVSGLELAQQRTEVANFDATLAALKEQRSVALTQLAILLGEMPQDIVLPTGKLSDMTLPSVQPVLPSELLVRRPDIRSAELDLMAANADIGVARAAFFPSLQIGAGASIGATPIDAATNTAANIGGSLLASIFQGGALKGQLEATKAVRDQLVANYRQSVLVAFKEAEDALAGLKSAQDRLVAYERAVEQSAIAYRISRDRFDAGSIDFSTFLDAQRSYLQTQESLIGARYDHFVAATQAFKAMGGGWSEAEALAAFREIK